MKTRRHESLGESMLRAAFTRVAGRGPGACRGAEPSRPIRFSAGGGPAPARSASASRSTRRPDLRGASKTTTRRSSSDQTQLEPSVVQLAPFEVARRHRTARTCAPAIGAFLPVRCRLRLIAENSCSASDVAAAGDQDLLPRAEQASARRSSIQGRDQTYVLPAQSVRMLSRWCRPTRPTSATPRAETFTDVDAAVVPRQPAGRDRRRAVRRSPA